MVRNVQKEDKGHYMCQINTDPMLSNVGYLNVVGGCMTSSRVILHILDMVNCQWEEREGWMHLHSELVSLNNFANREGGLVKNLLL